MSTPLEHYGLIGDSETAALVSRDGSIDWLCMPRFDAGACFAALLGDRENGRWRLAPSDEVVEVEQRYHDATLVLETEMRTGSGAVRLHDFQPPRFLEGVRGHMPDVVRIVEGVEGSVEVEMDLVVRFDYGRIVPWVTTDDEGWHAVAGPDALTLDTPVELVGEGRHTRSTFTVERGDRVPFVLTWRRSIDPPPEPIDPEAALHDTIEFWQDWSGRAAYDGRYVDAVHRSVLTLKALTYAPTGGLVAAPTASLPEYPGGSRNWDYRYTWLRDAALTLTTLVVNGYEREADDWRGWLLRAVAGDPASLQIMYGIAGERRLTEIELDWLEGYEGATPVRIGNAASAQRQIDVYGEVLDALWVADTHGLQPDESAWELQVALLDYLADVWDEPDCGIWEIRAEPQHFTHSRLMAWVAFDRAIRRASSDELDGDHDRWRDLRDRIRRDILEHGVDPDRGCFTQAYGSPDVDASLLLIPHSGFLAADDERFRATLEAVEEDLVVDGCFVRRYRTDSGVDGLSGEEGAFLLCSFWYVDALAAVGRLDDARDVFERVLALRTPLGLLAEMYLPERKRLIGNFPQAFSHLGLVRTAMTIESFERGERPAGWGEPD